MKRFIAAWTVMIVTATGCVADVAEMEDDGAGGSTATPEEIGEAVDAVSLGQCRLACAAGGAYFEKLFCPALGFLGSALCKIGVVNANQACRGGCRRKMDRKECADKCCDMQADQLDGFCAGPVVPEHLKDRCRTTVVNANGQCNKTCK